MSLVWQYFPLGGSDMLAMLAMADYADDDGGDIYPSIAAFAKKTRSSERTAQRTIHGLIDAGWITIVGNQQGGAPGKTRRYKLSVERLAGDKHTSVSERSRVANSHGCQNDTGDKSDGDGCQIVQRRVTTVSPEPSLTVINRQSTCPQLEIVKLYNHHLPAGTQVRPKLWNGARAKALQARWREDADRQNPEWWGKFFGYCAKSKFLTGQTATPGRDPFVVSLDWILKPSNFTKIIEGFYHRESAQ